MTELQTLIRRLDKLGIKLFLTGNYPWVYLKKVNDKPVTEKFQSDWGFVIGYRPLKEDGKFLFSDLGEIFKVIRKYK